MRAAQQALIIFFEAVAQKDAEQIERLDAEQCFDLGDARWCFTLPDLYRFLKQYDDVFGSIDYKEFRQVVFKTPINQKVKSYGVKIEISDNRDHVDRSTYALIWGEVE